MDPSRTDSVDQIVGAAKFLDKQHGDAVQHCLGKPVSRCLNLGVGEFRADNVAQITYLFGNIDNTTLPIGLHQGDAGLAQQQRSTGIGGQGTVKGCQAEFKNVRSTHQVGVKCICNR